MSDTTSPTDETPEYFEVRINKKVLKRIAIVATTAVVVAGAVFLKNNVSIETIKDSGLGDDEKDVNGL